MNNGDAIDAAIVATPEYEMGQVSMTLSSGRTAMVAMPKDATDREWLDLLAIIVSQVRPAFVEMQGKNPLSRILVPSRTPLP